MWLPSPSWTTNATKLLPPKQRIRLVNRTRIAEKADEYLEGRLLLVSAPAGYGKTSTLIQLHERLRTRGAAVAWLSIDADDNDVVRFAAHLVDTISRTGLVLDTRNDGPLGTHASAQHGLDSAPSATSLKTELLNALAALQTDLYLFLDDLHLLRDAGVIDLISALLLAPLDSLHLIVAAREVPALPLARLRAHGSLHELELGDLAFSDEEAAALASDDSMVHLTPEQIRALRRKTEGWPASLQMALIAVRAAPDPARFLDCFAGTDRAVAGFLIDEVLRHQPQHVQDFLLGTALLARFNAALVNAILGRTDAREMIDYCETHNLFVFSLDRDRHWYRYHHLFAELLRQRAHETQAERAASIHARACAWLACNGHPIDAIDHAFAIGDTARAGELVDMVSASLFASGQTATLNAYAQRLPPAVMKALPRLQLEVVWEQIIRWRFDEARDSLLEICQQLQRSTLPDAEIQALRQKLAHRDVMMRTFTDQLDALEEEGRTWINEYGLRDGFMSLSIRTALLMSRREAFDTTMTQAEWEGLREQFIDARAIYGTVFLDTVVGKTLHLRGELKLADAALRQAYASAVRLHGEASSYAAMPASELIALHYECNDLTAARAGLDRMQSLSAAFGLPDSVIARYRTQARLHLIDGRHADAHRTLDNASHTAEQYRLPRLQACVVRERISLLIAEGQPRDALQLTGDPRYREGFARVVPGRRATRLQLQYALSLARLHAESGDIAQGLTLMRRWLGHLRDRQTPGETIEVLLSLALLQLRGGDVRAAQRSLLDALRLKVVHGYVRLFLDASPELADMLATLEALQSDAALVQAPRPQVTECTPTADVIDSEAGGALTHKEVRILRLSAQHLTTSEIAQQLGVVDTTVKWYWRRIYAKLGVHRRTAAVREAALRGLIREGSAD